MSRPAADSLEVNVPREMGKFKPVIFGQIHAAGDKPEAGLRGPLFKRQSTPSTPPLFSRRKTGSFPRKTGKAIEHKSGNQLAGLGT
jgi:hypothetical protein